MKTLFKYSFASLVALAALTLLIGTGIVIYYLQSFGTENTGDNARLQAKLLTATKTNDQQFQKPETKKTIEKNQKKKPDVELTALQLQDIQNFEEFVQQYFESTDPLQEIYKENADSSLSMAFEHFLRGQPKGIELLFSSHINDFLGNETINPVNAALIGAFGTIEMEQEIAAIAFDPNQPTQNALKQMEILQQRQQLLPATRTMLLDGLATAQSSELLESYISAINVKTASFEEKEATTTKLSEFLYHNNSNIQLAAAKKIIDTSTSDTDVNAAYRAIEQTNDSELISQFQQHLTERRPETTLAKDVAVSTIRNEDATQQAKVDAYRILAKHQLTASEADEIEALLKL